MDNVAKYVTELNIARFLDLLEREQEPAQRQLWTKLLVAEEDRFGALSEKLENARRCLQNCSTRIGNQQALIDRMYGGHPSRQPAQDLLINLMEIRLSVQGYIDQLKKRIDP